METRRAASMGLLATMLVIATFWLGCSDDGTVFCDGLIPDATLENIWPNADSTYWTYRVTVHILRDAEGPGGCDSLYETAEEVPPAPSLDEIQYLLAHHDAGDPLQIEVATYRLEFAGDTTSSQGITAQNLREWVSTGDGQRALARTPGGVDPLLARIWVARPDLRPAIAGGLGRNASSGCGPGGDAGLLEAAGCFEYTCPLLIHGGVWRKTDQEIGAYADLDTLLAWKFLEADLSPGHEFTHQLIPSIADDVFLHCKVAGVTRARTEKCVFKKALDCVYLVDYGVYQYQGPVPEIQGYCRTFDYGRVLYVPGVGPVYIYERMLVSAGDPPGMGVGERFTGLTATGSISGTQY